MPAAAVPGELGADNALHASLTLPTTHQNCTTKPTQTCTGLARTEPSSNLINGCCWQPARACLRCLRLHVSSSSMQPPLAKGAFAWPRWVTAVCVMLCRWTNNPSGCRWPGAALTGSYSVCVHSCCCALSRFLGGVEVCSVGAVTLLLAEAGVLLSCQSTTANFR